MAPARISSRRDEGILSGANDARNAIVTIWDEDDYSIAPTINQVAAIVDTNYGFHNLQSSVFYTHFSLLKTIEGGFRLPCLNHACDKNVQVMSDLFSD
jgi:hypothetical protein